MASKISATKTLKIILLACKSVKMVVLKDLQSIGKNRYRQNNNPGHMIQFCFSLGLQGVDLCGFLAHKKPVLPPPPQKKNLARRCVFRVFRNIFSTKTKVKWHTLHFTLKKTRKKSKTPRVPKQKKKTTASTPFPPNPNHASSPSRSKKVTSQISQITGWMDPDGSNPRKTHGCWASHGCSSFG